MDEGRWRGGPVTVGGGRGEVDERGKETDEMSIMKGGDARESQK